MNIIMSILIISSTSNSALARDRNTDSWKNEIPKGMEDVRTYRRLDAYYHIHCRIVTQPSQSYFYLKVNKIRYVYGHTYICKCMYIVYVDTSTSVFPACIKLTHSKNSYTILRSTTTLYFIGI